MRFLESKLAGAFVVELERIVDDRGFFARSFCRREFEQQGLEPAIAQCNISYNEQQGILRGMHFQTTPHEEAKLVRCTRGSVYDVIVDLRLESETFKQWASFELSADNRRSLYVPRGFAHGFVTLEAHSELTYQMSEFYHPENAAGFRWDDPAIGIDWPVTLPVVLKRDSDLPAFADTDYGRL